MPLIIIPILLVLAPVIEIAVFIYVGQAIGVWKVIALILLSAIVGIMLLRYQSLSVLKKINREIRQGHTPEAGLFNGFLIVAGAILLVIPGFVSDVIGLLLMIPFVRGGLWQVLKRQVTVKGFSTGGRGRGFRRRRKPDEDIVDLSPEDFERRGPPKHRPGSEIDHQE